jgi:predicted enzyme related to lactoylglutathione lyase
VREHGGAVYVEPMQLPNGRIAVVADPEGGVFAFWEGDYDD